MAKQLVSAMTGEFEPENYKDEYRDALMQVIEAKIEGHAPVVQEPVEESGNLIDLMAALEASVKATKAARESAAPVSVADAKKERARRSSEGEKAPAEKKPAARRAAAAKSDDADEADEPAAAASGGRSRRRKSA